MPRPLSAGDRYGHAKVISSVGAKLPGGENPAATSVSVDRVTITFPLPSPKLHAHAKGHWRPKAEATKAARELARDTVQAYCPRPFRWEVARIYLRFFWGTETRHDTLNAAQSAKPYIDGMADAGLIEGDHWRALEVGGVSSHLDRENPRLEITVERAN